MEELTNKQLAEKHAESARNWQQALVEYKQESYQSGHIIDEWSSQRDYHLRLAEVYIRLAELDK